MWWLATATAGTVCDDADLCTHTTIAEGLAAADPDLDLVGPGPFAGFTVGPGVVVSVTGDLYAESVIVDGSIDVQAGAELTLSALSMEGVPYAGSFLTCFAGTVRLTDVIIDGGDFGNRGLLGTGCEVELTRGELDGLAGAAKLTGGTLTTFGGTVWSDNSSDAGGALWVTDAEVDLHDDTFQYNWALEGGAIRATGDTTLIAAGVTFRENWTYGDGGAISQVSIDHDGSLMLDAVEWDGNWAEGSGGVVWVSAATFVQIEHSGWNSAGENHADSAGGAVFVADGDSVNITHSRFVGDHADESGGAVAVTGSGGVSIAENEFVGTWSSIGGAIWLLDSIEVRVRDNVFDGTHADLNGGAVAAEGSAGVRVQRNRYCWTEAYDSGGGFWALNTTAGVTNNGFVGVWAPTGGAVAAVGSTVTVSHATVTQADATKAWLAFADENSIVSVDHTLTAPAYAPTVAVIGAEVDTTNFEAGPLPAGGERGTATWLGSSLPGDLVCDSELRQHPDSAFFADGDDYGMFGGPEADPPDDLPDVPDPTGDADGDGAEWRYDCDDGDPEVGGFSFELCNDGKDNDCDGFPEPPARYLDLDGDGFGGGEPWCDDALAPKEDPGVDVGGDCADDDPASHPGAVDVCGDRVDQDCSGRDARCDEWSLIGGRCGCAGPGGSAAPAVLLVLAGLRRRAVGPIADRRPGSPVKPAVPRQPATEPFNTEVSERQPATEPFSTDVSERQPATEPFSTEVSERQPATEPFSTEVSERQAATEPFSTEVSERQPATEPFSTEVCERQPATEPFSTDVSERQVPTEAFSTEVSGRQAATEPLSTEVSERQAATEPFSTEVSGRHGATAFSTEVSEGRDASFGCGYHSCYP